MTGVFECKICAVLGLMFFGGIVMNKKQKNININEDLGLKQVLG